MFNKIKEAIEKTSVCLPKCVNAADRQKRPEATNLIKRFHSRCWSAKVSLVVVTGTHFSLV